MIRRVLTYKLCKEIASHYPNAKALERADQAVCNKSRQKGWLYEFYPNMGGRILDYDTCYAIAKKCIGRTEFHNIDRYAYDMARDKGWLEIWFPEKIVKQSSVTFEECVQVRELLRKKGLNKVSDFDNYNGNMCKIARKRGWIEKLGFQSKEESFRLAGLRCNKYTIEYALSIAHKYDSYSKFKHEEPELYDWCCRHKIIRDFTWLKRDKHLRYTDRELFDIARQYSNFSDFRQKEEKAYTTICKRHKKWIISFLKRNTDVIDGVIKDNVYVYEFADSKVAYIGRTVDLVSRHNAHSTKLSSPVYRYATSIGVDVPKPKILTDRITIKDGGEIECQMIALYKKNGWTLLNSVPGGGMGGIGSGKLNNTKIVAICSQFKWWSDLIAVYPQVYNKIRKRNIKANFPWLKYKKLPNGVWSKMTKTNAYEYAKQFDRRNDFAEEYPVLAKFCRKNGWMKEWFPDEESVVPKRVCQYTKDGVLIAVYDNMVIAGQSTGITHQSIRSVIKRNRKTAGGFVWALESTDKANIKFPGAKYKPRGSKRKVYQLTTDGQIIKLHNSITEGAAEIGISSKRISDALSGRKKFAGGFMWMYADSDLT